VLSFLVLVLAFLAASFLARNSDLWFHLGTGRLLTQRGWWFGTDPFTYTTRGVSWANHAWLFDMLLYGLHALVGGTGLVVLKALLVTALAGVLLRVRRPDGAAWVPAVGTALAVLAMSPRLLLQPACVSYFLLGLTFALLALPHIRQEAADGGPRRLPRAFWLLALFVLWVNLDDWFLLGPVLVALFWLGERLQGERHTPGWLVPVGFAVCLLNPYTFHAFTLPPEVSPVTWTSGLPWDARFQAQFASPWQPAHRHAAAALNAAALAYYALVLLGVLSFLARPRAARGWRLLVWLPFALLAAWQARLIPFFAVVAAPITVLNVQDFLAARARTASPGPRTRLLPRAGRLLLGLGLLVLIGLAWPGWLAGYGREERRVAWGVQADPSLRRAAETLHAWRRQHLLGAPDEERVFAPDPEVAQYAAWFAPGEEFFFDHRYPLFAGVVRDYETVCRGLEPGPAADAGPADDWQEVLRRHHVAVVVFADRDPRRLSAVLHRLLADRENWTLLSVSGEGVIAGWNAARAAGAFAPLAFDADRLAFAPEDEQARRELPAAPEAGPPLPPPRLTAWERLTRPPAAPAWESAAAGVYLQDFEETQDWQGRQRLRRRLAGYAAGLAGVPASAPAVPRVVVQLGAAHPLLGARGAAESFLLRDQLGPYFAALLDRPPALPLLAVRAARRAVAAEPADASAWLRLGQAYIRLRDLTCERSRDGLLPPLVQLRHVQIATVLEEAVRLDPDLEAAHLELAYLYGAENSLDLALDHQREALHLARRAGPHPGESAEDYAYRLTLLGRDIVKLDELVRKQREAYAAAVPGARGDRVAMARRALAVGLARQAADEILLPTPPDVLGPPGMKLELEVLLALGRAQDVRAILRDDRFEAGMRGLGYYDIPPPKSTEDRAVPPVPYHWPTGEWLRVLQAASTGDYAQAREDLRAIRSGLHAGHERLRGQQRDLERGAALLLPGLFAGPPLFLPAFTARALARMQEQRVALQVGDPVLRAHQADLCVLEGLLALEQGEPEDARSAFAAAQELGAPPAGRFAGAPIAAEYLSLLGRPESLP
jgi:hypothetical protein